MAGGVDADLARLKAELGAGDTAPPAGQIEDGEKTS